MNVTTTIDVREIVQEYPDPSGHGINRVLDRLSFTLTGPSINVLMGRSGCGKSTLMRMLGGVRPPKVVTPTSGIIALNGEPLIDKSPDAITVFQNPVNRPDLTVRQNIELPFKMAIRNKTPMAEIKERVEEALVAVSLKDKEKRYPSELSGGQNQRVMLARGLVTKPKILLLDEPFSALDPILRGEMQQLLIDIWNKYPCLVVMVTHDVNEAIALGDRIMVLSGAPARIVFDRANPIQNHRTLNPENAEIHTMIAAALK